MMQVRYYFREYRKGGFSIEGIFHLMKKCLTGKVDIEEYHLNPKLSKLKNIQVAAHGSEGINHITGDVYYLAIGFKGNKNVLTIHDLGHYENLKPNWLKHKIYHYFWFYFPFKKAAIVTVVSEFTRQQVLRYFPYMEAKLRIVANPIKPIFQYAPKVSLAAKPVILQIGTGPHKNLDNLVVAVSDMDVHLDIVADINEDTLAKLKANGTSYTQYGRLTDEEIYERYKACDILFFASFHEGFGMPIIEAQAIGRPVITSDVGAMKEVAKNTAVLVDPHNPQQIQEAIHQLLTDNEYYKQVIASGLKNSAPYEANNIAAQYLSIYKELAEG
jgi:glycosyltransferase involved in cell wall biosynthesis